MAELGGALLTRIFAKSVAEQALTPWWDKVKEYSTYGLIILGKTFLFSGLHWNRDQFIIIACEVEEQHQPTI